MNKTAAKNIVNRFTHNLSIIISFNWGNSKREDWYDIEREWNKKIYEETSKMYEYIETEDKIRMAISFGKFNEMFEFYEMFEFNNIKEKLSDGYLEFYNSVIKWFSEFEKILFSNEYEIPENPINDITTEEWKISNRTKNALRHNGFSTVRDILEHESYYGGLRNAGWLGKKSFEELHEKMLEFGIEIKW